MLAVRVDPWHSLMTLELVQCPIKFAAEVIFIAEKAFHHSSRGNQCRDLLVLPSLFISRSFYVNVRNHVPILRQILPVIVAVFKKSATAGQSMKLYRHPPIGISLTRQYRFSSSKLRPASLSEAERCCWRMDGLLRKLLRPRVAWLDFARSVRRRCSQTEKHDCIAFKAHFVIRARETKHASRISSSSWSLFCARHPTVTGLPLASQVMEPPAEARRRKRTLLSPPRLLAPCEFRDQPAIL
jgi:hypothetical protein